jgi:hypothetical protein
MEVTSPQARRFDATLEFAPIGAVGVNLVRGAELDVYRTRRPIKCSRRNGLRRRSSKRTATEKQRYRAGGNRPGQYLSQECGVAHGGSDGRPPLRH